MKNHRIIFVSGLVVLNFVLLPSCATSRDLIRDNTVAVERINSNRAYIKFVSAQQFDKKVSVRGTVKRRHSGRGTVRDHVDVVIIAPDGSIVSNNDTPYYRKNIKKGEANFHLALSDELRVGSVFRLSLHNAPSHSDGAGNR
jgi:hypothetical protein